MKKSLLLATLLVGASTLFSQAQSVHNQLSPEEKKAGWELLFDGQTTKGWHVYNKDAGPSAWKVKNGVLFCDSEDYESVRGDLVTDRSFRNFEFMFDWNISKEGNSGVFFNVQEKEENPTAWTSGPEYQLLERTHFEQDQPLKQAGALFGLNPRLNAVQDKAAGEWNQGRIKQQNGVIEFYLNGVLTVRQDMTTPEWAQKIAASNFKTFPNFGKAIEGQLALQDWSKGISFRNLKIRTMP